jgi:phosphoribosyl-AMP cyclohydrolase
MTTSNALPFPAPGSAEDVEAGDVLSPRFDTDGLIAAVATDADTGDVLMLAWMNAEALKLSIESGIAHFFSRSRKRIWKKGEESGNLLTIAEMRIDCDQDAIWMKVRVAGASVACHTGARSCFYRVVPTGESAQPRLRTA